MATMIKRMHALQFAFLTVMLVAWPVALFHLVSGRPAQAAMAAGASIVGLALLSTWLMRPAHSDH